ncbi:MAG: hypothetical protein AAGA50_15880 [Pseudomonadota bacterium]
MHVAERSSRRPLPQRAKERDPDSEAASWAPSENTDEPELILAPVSDRSSEVRVSADLIKAALNNALASAEFQSAPQLRAFLEFVVDATLSKSREKIKGYTIAVEALGRSEDFNPVTDPIVRVEAARLRRRLDKYYAGSGANDPVRITIPKGSYTPQFSEQTVSPVHGASANQEVTDDFSFDPEEVLLDKTAQFSLPNFAPGKDEVPFLSGLSSQLPELTPFESSSPDTLSASTKLNQPGTLFGPMAAMRSLSEQRLPLPAAIALGLCCFAVGYLAGML